MLEQAPGLRLDLSEISAATAASPFHEGHHYLRSERWPRYGNGLRTTSLSTSLGRQRERLLSSLPCSVSPCRGALDDGSWSRRCPGAGS